MRRRSSRRRSGIKRPLERSEGELKQKMSGTSANKRTGTNDGKSCGGGVVATPGFLVLMQLQLIGERVSVRWTQGRGFVFYDGTVTGFSERQQKHRVVFDDGTVREYDFGALEDAQWRLLSATESRH